MAGRDLDRGRLLIPDPITVTLTRPESLGAGPQESVTVAYVQEQAEADETAESPMGHGDLGAVTTTFHLWAIECDGLEPGHDWLITKQSDGSVWRVTGRAEKLAHGRRYRVRCVLRQNSEG